MPRDRARQTPPAETEPDEPLDEFERAVVRALAAILVREIGDEVEAEYRARERRGGREPSEA